MGGANQLYWKMHLDCCFWGYSWMVASQRHFWRYVILKVQLVTHNFLFLRWCQVTKYDFFSKHFDDNIKHTDLP